MAISFLPLQGDELPDDVDWCFILRVMNGEVHRVCPPTAANLREKRFRARSKNRHKLADEQDLSGIEKKIQHKLKQSRDQVKPLRLGKILDSSQSGSLMISLKAVCRCPRTPKRRESPL